jgi:hypothetical protein
MALDPKCVVDVWRRTRAAAPNAAIAAICSIPDGLEMKTWPVHLIGPNCWCRPLIAEGIDCFHFCHKDPSVGEFDA